jgi:hypothetical protein
MARSHLPHRVVAERLAKAAGALAGLRSIGRSGEGGALLELGNLVEQMALDVMGDARTAGSLLVWCFDD